LIPWLLVNGGINLSELDGWWSEAYTPEVGWALGDGQEHGDDPAWDAVEAVALYERLEREVIPEFYTREKSGIPTAWVKRMRESMARLTPRFCANRTVCEYTEQHYLPAATAYHLRIANKGAIGTQIVNWRHSLEQKWATMHFGEVKVETRGDQHVFDVQVFLNDLDPKAVRAAEAVALFCYQVKKWIGSFAAALGGLDTLVFAGGIGENAPLIRARICDGLGFLGIELEEKRNAANEDVISTSASRVVVRVIRTDEELMIAKTVCRVLGLGGIKEN